VDSDMNKIEAMLGWCANVTQELYAIKVFGEMRHAGLSVLDSVEGVYRELCRDEGDTQ